MTQVHGHHRQNFDSALNWPKVGVQIHNPLRETFASFSIKVL
jgi:hypothetical protein